MEEWQDKIVGGFRLKARLGGGAEGKVFRAVCVEDRHGIVPVGKEVALKVAIVHDDPAQWKRLQHRVAAFAELSDPHVVRYLGCFRDVWTDGFNDVYVIVQELLAGETLKDRIARDKGGLDFDELLRIADAALAGLSHVAQGGVVHRDVKPSNIFLCSDGSVKLIDFGVARQGDGSLTLSPENLRGSFDYMAPDFTDKEFHGDVLSDVFSMGAVVHEMATGELPYSRFAGDFFAQYNDFMRRWKSPHAAAEIEIAHRPLALLQGLESVLEKALAVEREERFADFEAFRSALGGVRFTELQGSGGRVFRVLRHVGSGGFGEVFKAREWQTGQMVAVKHLLRADAIDRFETEAETLRTLGEAERPEDGAPLFTRFLDFFKKDGEAYLAMDFLDGMPGHSLLDAIRRARGGLPQRDVFIAFIRYARGLSRLHARGIVHRDIKPGNLYFPEGRPECSAIMDMGVVRDLKGTVTVGQVPSTLAYTPPEVFLNATRGDSAMDVYALGLSLYEALTGKTAYPRLSAGTKSAYETYRVRAEAGVPPLFDAPAVAADGELLDLLTDMTAPDVSRRIAHAEEIVGRLEMLLARSADQVLDETTADAADANETVPWGEDETEQTADGSPTNAPSVAVEACPSPIPEPSVQRQTRSHRVFWSALAGLLVVGLSFAGWRYYAFLRAAEEKSMHEVEIRRAREEQIRRETEERTRKEFEEKMQREAAEKAAAEKAQREAEEKAAAEKAQREAKEKAAAEKALREAEEKAAAEKARREAAEKAAAEEARREAEEKARVAEKALQEAKEKARVAEKAQREAEQKAAAEKARREEEEKARAGEKAQREAEQKAAAEKAQREAEEKAAAEKAQREAEEKAAAEKAQREAEEKAAAEKAQRETQNNVVAVQPVPDAVKNARLFYDEELYYDVVKYFHEAHQAGYALTAADRRMFDDAFTKENARLKTMIERCNVLMQQGKTLIRPLAEIEEERRRLIRWHQEVR